MGGRERVLVVGGTGYLGQHLLQGFTEAQDAVDLAFTHHSSPPPQPLLHAIPQPLIFQVDLRTGQGFESISQSFGQPDVVVNCAALSVPRSCEVDPAAAMSVNVPSALVQWFSSFKSDNTLLIHLSTDQVYEGTKSFYKEENETAPVNVYGKSKVAAEDFITASCSNFAILRSSIIFGPQTISPVPKSLPIQDILTYEIIGRGTEQGGLYVVDEVTQQGVARLAHGTTDTNLALTSSWMDSVLAQGNEMTFFHDEFRCPVYVKDVVTIIRELTNSWFSDGKQMQLVLNVGGPDRVSRVQMAEAVASARGYNMSLIKPVSASSVDRGVKSPSDISMDITRLIQTLDFSPTSFQDGVRLTLADEVNSS